MTDTAPLPLPHAGNAARDERDPRIDEWIDRLVAAGVEPRGELLLAGEGLAAAALAAARLVGPRGRVVALAASEQEAAGLRERAAASGAGQLEVRLAPRGGVELERPVPLALLLSRGDADAAGCGVALARIEATLARGGRALTLDAPG